jgi:hypothetical protein
MSLVRGDRFWHGNGVAFDLLRTTDNGRSATLISQTLYGEGPGGSNERYAPAHIGHGGS